MTIEGRAEKNESDARGEDGDRGLFDALSATRTSSWPGIPHYYGNAARQLLVGGAALMLLASPLYADNVRIEFPFEVAGALAAVGFGAFTNPRAKWTLVGDAIVSGVGAIVYATWGIFEYETINPIAFVLRLVIAIIFLFAFYFSMKTVRAFTLHSIGRRESVDEFETDEERAEEDRLEREHPIGPRAEGGHE